MVVVFSPRCLPSGKADDTPSPALPRKTRHTTHLDGLPKKVKIIRDRHPLQGQSLEILSWTHRNNIFYLMLVLPDGSRSLIPASWTDLSGQEPKSLTSVGSHCISNVIATTPYLLHARKIVDALLRRLYSSVQEDLTISKEERIRAQTIGTVANIASTVPDPKDLENTDPATKTKCHNRSGRPNQQNSLYREHRPD